MNVGPARVGELTGAVELPLSKSESTRVSVIRALCGDLTEDSVTAECDDARLLKDALMRCCTGDGSAGGRMTIDIGHGAAPARFLAAFLASRAGGRYVLTGSERMRQRPVGPMVEALRELGAEIEYVGEEGRLPLRIDGRVLRGGKVGIDAGVSSQFISALMLIGPTLGGGIEIRLKGRPVSMSYIRMTERVMSRFGCVAEIGGESIIVPEGRYVSCDYRPEADWSAATFWYELMAVAGRGELTLRGLRRESCQPDRLTADIFRRLGVESECTVEGVVIRSTGRCEEEMVEECANVPDIVPALMAACCARGVRFRFDGVRTLALKESDRRVSMAEELYKFGYVITREGDDSVIWDGRRVAASEDVPTVSVWNDHRVAMSVAMMGWERRFVVEDGGVVSKSYPDFWSHLSEYIRVF